MTSVASRPLIIRLRHLAGAARSYAVGALLMLGLVGTYFQEAENSAFHRLSSAAGEEVVSIEGRQKLSAYLSDSLRSRFEGLSQEEREVVLRLAYVARLAHERDLNFGRFSRPEWLPRFGVRDHLNDPSGKCASYTLILGKLLSSSGYTVRKVGLASSKTSERSQHHVLEVWLPEARRWAVLDTIFAHAFVDASGHLRSAAEVRADWGVGIKELPAGYDAESFSYACLYYTNWRRLPGFGIIEALFPDADAWLQAHEVALPFVIQLNGYGWIGTLAFGAAVMCIIVPWWLRCRASRRLLVASRNDEKCRHDAEAGIDDPQRARMMIEDGHAKG